MIFKKQLHNVKKNIDQFNFFVDITGNGQGSSKKIAQNTCCLSIVRQLFHMGIIGPSGTKIGSQKPNANKVCFFLI